MASEQLRILIVGNGGREHAFAWKLSQSPLVDIIYVAPGNGGTGLGTNSKITNANVKGDDYAGLVAFAQKNQVNLVVPGPEAPLVDGIQGYFQAGESRIPFFFFFWASIPITPNKSDPISSNSRHSMLRSLQGCCPYGGLQDLLQGLHAAPPDPHRRVRKLL
jgi:hypothetical protein